MKFTEGFLWDYPGIPSVAVSYLKTNDYFFSGHIGMPLIMGLEARKHKLNYIFYFALAAILVEGSILILVRVHYIIDLITGLICAHYIYNLMDEYIPILDDSCISMKVKQAEEGEERVALKSAYE